LLKAWSRLRKLAEKLIELVHRASVNSQATIAEKPERDLSLNILHGRVAGAIRYVVEPTTRLLWRRATSSAATCSERDKKAEKKAAPYAVRDLHLGFDQSEYTPRALGAAFYIPTEVVPPLLVTYALIFSLLLRSKAS